MESRKCSRSCRGAIPAYNPPGQKKLRLPCRRESSSQRQTASAYHARKGFTLIELLVVIAIMGLLKKYFTG